jgi:hypothetical protein
MARRSQRHWRAAAVMGSVVAAGTAIVVVLAAGQTPDTSPEPSGRPTTGVGARTPTLVPKMSPQRTNEFVLQYPGPAAADRALVNAVHHLKQCPRPPGVWSFIQDHVNRPIHRDPAAEGVDAEWGDERLTDVVQGRDSGTAYAFFVARADNVLVVIEGNGTDDAGTGWRDVAVSRVLPQYHPGTVVPGGEVIASQPFLSPTGNQVKEPGWPPRITRCVPDPNTWGAQEAQGVSLVSNNNNHH